MATYGFIAASEDRNNYHEQYFGILAYAVEHMLGHVEFVEEAEFGLEDLKNRRLSDLVKTLVRDDVLIISDILRLGRSTWESIGILVEILKRGAAVCAVNEEYDLGNNIKFRGIPCVLSVLLVAWKEHALSRTKGPMDRKQADGAAVLGRPVGSLGHSRLDGSEIIVKKLLAEGSSKSAVARKLGISRPALNDWAKSRGLFS